MRYLIIFILLIPACATQEHLPRVSPESAATFSCQGIADEIKIAENHLANIGVGLEPEGMFEAILLSPVMALDHMEANKAEENAELRIEDLEKLQVEKGCVLMGEKTPQT
jgi:hypothetical protein